MLRLEGMILLELGLWFAITVAKFLEVDIDRIQENFEVECAEAIVVKYTFRFSKNFECSKIIVESDVIN